LPALLRVDAGVVDAREKRTTGALSSHVDPVTVIGAAIIAPAGLR
jgi:hypothetical protein